MGKNSYFFPSLLTTSNFPIGDLFTLQKEKKKYSTIIYNKYGGGFRSLKKIFLLIMVFFLIGLLLLGTIQASVQQIPSPPPTPPTQPSEGPGGSNYTHAGVRQTKYGWGAREFWIFEPTTPTPETAPLIIFNHGWSAFKPLYYQAWIDHLVKRGNIVVYPRYQAGLVIGLRFATPNAITAIKRAIHILETGDHVRPDLEKCAIVGHSLGGGITAEMAVYAAEQGLPVPKAIMPVQPFLRFDTMLSNFQGIPASTLILVIVGEDDFIALNNSGKKIFTTSTQVPLDHKDFVIQRTDRYGSPPLKADHGAPLCIPGTTTVDAMDYYSTWKLFDALTDYAFYGTNQDYCLGNTPEQRFMGLWSDGKPVKELLVTDTP